VPASEDSNLYTAFASRFPADRDTTVLAAPDGTGWRYADLEAVSARFAGALVAAGLQPGDRVTVQAPKSPAYLGLYLGCLRAGLVFHPLNDGYRPEELRFLLDDAEPALAVCDPAAAGQFGALLSARGTPVLTLDARGEGTVADAARAQVQVQDFATRPRVAGDGAVLLYTSGTTGRPKGALVTHGNLVANATALVSAWGFTPADRLLHALPVYHAHGLFVGIGCTLLAGASMLFLPRFDAAEVVRHLPSCTVMMGVPTFYVRLLAEAGLTREATECVRLFISGSAPLTPATFAAFRERTGHAILERYGMTETGMNTSNPLHGERRPGSVGRPLPGVIVRIADDTAGGEAGVGEIELRGPNVFPGYWRAPEATREAFTADGFFRTGDLGRVSDDGYLDIVGRSKDLVISGGLNVYPREVELELDALGGVAESAVIGAPHPDLGEAVVALVVLEPGSPADEARLVDALVDALRGRLAGFKLPKRVLAVAELPRNSMGKVDKARLRREHAGIFSAETPHG
jgi:malonyl-CoA/methylmalonyl-CoA synthetase